MQTASEGFDAAKVYREASPGVVTIRSIFDESAAEGSGFVLDTEGRIVTNAHVVTDGEGSDRKEAKAVFVEFPDRNVVPAKIVGFDPFADVALLEVKPDGFDLHPLQLGDDHDLVVGQPVAAIGNPFGEQSVALGRDRLGDRPLGRLADPVPDRGRDPDRRLDQPGQLGRAAARSRRPRRRHQPADRDQLRRQRRRRLRGADLGGEALARPARADGQRRVRLHRRHHARRSTRSSPTSSASTPTTGACWPKWSPAARPTKPA